MQITFIRTVAADTKVAKLTDTPFFSTVCRYSPIKIGGPRSKLADGTHAVTVDGEICNIRRCPGSIIDAAVADKHIVISRNSSIDDCNHKKTDECSEHKWFLNFCSST